MNYILQGPKGDLRNLIFALFADGFNPSKGVYSSIGMYLSCLNMSSSARAAQQNIMLYGFIPGTFKKIFITFKKN